MGEPESRSADGTHSWHAFLGSAFPTRGFPNSGLETSAAVPEIKDAPAETADPSENQPRLSLSACPVKHSVLSGISAFAGGHLKN